MKLSMIKTYVYLIFILCSTGVVKAQDNLMVKEISTLFEENATLAKLNFPNSTQRFYQKNTLQQVWIKASGHASKTLAAMSLLSGVCQFGLYRNDYHPDELTYEKLKMILEDQHKVNPTLSARFDVFLTDAMLSLINHLHYGKLNPEFTETKIDEIQQKDFSAEGILEMAMQQQDLANAILDAQPKNKIYLALQSYLQFINKQGQINCDVVPDQETKKLSINMERLRWVGPDEDTYLLINIPAFTLTFYQPDTVFNFKVVVGKPHSQTPTLQGSITYFTTAPDWRVPRSIFEKEFLPKAIKNNNYFNDNHYAVYNLAGQYVETNVANLQEIRKNPAAYYVKQSSGCDNALGVIVFRFANAFDIYLHDTPEQRLFNEDKRAFSHGCVRVQHAEQLAGLLLKQDGSKDRNKEMTNAISSLQKKNFKFNKPIPIKIIYLTCLIKDGLPVNYEDVYQLDQELENRLYYAKN
jgi:L,D-transpeptidase YcbB